MLWLCIHLPQLPLDALQAGRPDQPVAVLDASRHVLVTNAVARAHGITTGLPATSAQALLPALRCLPRQSRAEERALRSLAGWALRFTSWVSPAPPRELLLEIGGSLKLLGPAHKLRDDIQAGLQQLGYDARIGVAPTPRAAQVLARAGHAIICQHKPELPSLLQPLPLQLLGWDAALCDRIHGVGVRNLGEALALPRSGFNQRYGREHRHQLDQLLGQAADPRPAFQPPRRYRRSLETAQPSCDWQALLPGFQRLFADLSATLRGVDSGIARLEIRLHHCRARPTVLDLGLRSPGRDAGHWLSLLRERLARVDLQAEVRAIEVRAGEFLGLGRTQAGFWQQGDAEDEQWLLERLAARLGPARLCGLRSCPGHAPELAWRQVDAGQGQDAAVDTRPRPLWLLPEPEPVDYTQLQLLSRPERLETRWWGQDCRRDYYRARDRRGRQLWVFRPHDQPRQWFIHGLFG